MQFNMNLTKDLREFLSLHKTLIAKNNFELFFRQAAEKFTAQAINRYCELFKKADIDFLSHMTFLPSGFAMLEDIKTFDVPQHILELGKRSFAFSDLVEITIPSNVLKIEEEAFGYCDALKKAVIAEGCVELGYAMFTYCEELEELYLPQSIKSIPDRFIEGCSNLKQIVYKGSMSQWNNLPGVENCSKVSVKCSNGTVMTLSI